MRILADAGFARPYGPDRLTQTLLPPMSRSGSFHRAVSSRSLFPPRLPAIRRTCVSIWQLGAIRAGGSRSETERLLFMCRQQIGLEGGELERFLGMGIERRHCSHRGRLQSFVLEYGRGSLSHGELK